MNLRIRGESRFYLLTVTATVVVGICISFALAGLVRREEDRRLRVQFERLASDRVRSLSALIQTSLDYTESVKALFLSSSEVNRGEFRSFVNHVLVGKPHILACEWVPVVPEAKRDAFQAEARRLGFSRYVVRSLREERTPATVYYPVLFTEPFEANEIDQGLDYGSVTSRREAIEAARDEDRPRATRAFPLDRADHPLDPFGVQVFVPVRAAGRASDSQLPELTEVVGFISMVFMIRESVEAALTPLTPAGVDIYLYEEAPVGQRHHVYTHTSRTRNASKPIAAPAPSYEDLMRYARMPVPEKIDVAGQTWWVVMVPAPRFFELYGTNNSLFVLLGGIVSSALLGYLVLLTVRRLLEREEKTQLHLAAVVESSADAIYTKNIDGTIKSWNAAAEHLFGYTAREIIGESALILYPSSLQPSSTFSERLRNDTRVQRYETVRTKKSGESFNAAMSVSPIRNVRGEVTEAAVIVQDITERKEIEKMKDDFIHLASHQLRTPITTVRLYAEMLLDGHAGELQSLQREFVDVINDNTQRMVDLVTTLLNISRIEGATMMVKPEPHDLGALLQRALSEVLMRMETKSIRLDQEINSSLPAIPVDPVLVQEIYANLLSNALKYTPEGGSVSVSLYPENGAIVTRITDTGYGIPRQDHAHIFSRFYRGENVLAHEAEGTGLGLYLVKSLCDLSGCRIWFESDEGAGTTFWYAVPLEGMKERVGSSRLEALASKVEVGAWQES